MTDNTQRQEDDYIMNEMPGANNTQVSNDQEQADDQQVNESHTDDGAYETYHCAADQMDAQAKSATDAADAKVECNDRTAQLEEELARTKDQLVRTLADAENLRKRTQRDRQEASKYAISSFAKDLLDFADNFQRALGAIPDDIKDADERVKGIVGGIEAMERDLLNTFDKHGIKKIEPLDQAFDPNFHEVMFEADGGDKPAGTIIQVIEPGYLLNDRLLRPARVGVAKQGGNLSQSGHHIDEQA